MKLFCVFHRRMVAWGYHVHCDQNIRTQRLFITLDSCYRVTVTEWLLWCFPLPTDTDTELSRTLGPHGLVWPMTWTRPDGLTSEQGGAPDFHSCSVQHKLNRIILWELLPSIDEYNKWSFCAVVTISSYTRWILGAKTSRKSVHCKVRFTPVFWLNSVQFFCLRSAYVAVGVFKFRYLEKNVHVCHRIFNEHKLQFVIFGSSRLRMAVWPCLLVGVTSQNEERSAQIRCLLVGVTSQNEERSAQIRGLQTFFLGTRQPIVCLQFRSVRLGAKLGQIRDSDWKQTQSIKIKCLFWLPVA